MATGPFLVNLSEARRYWGWFIGLGFLLIMLGLVALEEPLRTTILSVMLFGFLLVISGVGEFITAFQTRTWGGLLYHALFGFLDIALAVILLSEPVRGSIWLTYVLALFFLFGGALELGFAAATRYPNWGWGVFSGIVTVLLGALVLAHWPDDTLAFIGIYVGVVLLMRGWMWIMLGVALSALPATPGETTPPKTA
jgi:uncharacterized membrane protein HdeD (DUF308 family)